MLPLRPDALTLRADHLRRWLAGAHPDDLALYHVGELSRDVGADPDLRERRDWLRVMLGLGAVTFLQGRGIDGTMCYYARRTRRPVLALPREVTDGRVAALHYLGLASVRTRSPEASIVEALCRDLGIGREDARALQVELVAAGYLTATSPRALTDAGQAALR